MVHFAPVSPYPRPERVLIPDDQAKIKNVSRLHRRRDRAFPPPSPPLAGNDPEKTLRRGVERLETRNRAGLAERPWWIGVGTALGFAREQDFLAWDNDIDVRILLDYRDVSAAQDYAALLAAHFSPVGFRLVQEAYWEHRPVQLYFADLENGGLRFDVYFFYEGLKDDTIFNANAESLREKPKRLIDTLARVPWPTAPDIMVQVPDPIEDYLEWRFGPGWRIPDRNPVTRAAAETCLQPLPSIKVLTYGTWDGFHHGHLRIFERAKRMGDRLIVGVVSDELCRIKGKDPIQSETQRAAVIGALECVDEVFIQRELDQKEKDIDRFGVHFLVVGDDWKDHPRFEQVRGYSGVELVYLSRTKGVSSTLLRGSVTEGA